MGIPMGAPDPSLLGPGARQLQASLPGESAPLQCPRFRQIPPWQRPWTGWDDDDGN